MVAVNPGGNMETAMTLLLLVMVVAFAYDAMA
jgi:hypothetical protein